MGLQNKTKWDKAISLIAILTLLLGIVNKILFVTGSNPGLPLILNRLFCLFLSIPALAFLIQNKYIQSIKTSIYLIPFVCVLAVIEMVLKYEQYGNLNFIVVFYLIILILSLFFAIPDFILLSYLKKQKGRKTKRTVLIIIFSIFLIIGILVALWPKSKPISINLISGFLMQICYILLVLKPYKEDQEEVEETQDISESKEEEPCNEYTDFEIYVDPEDLRDPEE
jgi:hypothetical protein